MLKDLEETLTKGLGRAEDVSGRKGSVNLLSPRMDGFLRGFMATKRGGSIATNDDFCQTRWGSVAGCRSTQTRYGLGPCRQWRVCEVRCFHALGVAILSSQENAPVQVSGLSGIFIRDLTLDIERFTVNYAMA
jgi:hypothetical protein